jgi:putative CocE/NonD family hydrolase
VDLVLKKKNVIVKYTRQEEYEVAIFRDVMVPMRDGVRLATDLYFPSKDGVLVEGKFPAILDRTPYDKIPRAAVANNPEYFVKRGYVFVFQDERGHGGSEGEFYIYVNLGRDGYDAVEWIAKEPWSNGIVVTSGYSYDGISQNAIARENPSHLKAMFPGFGTANYHQDVEGTNGAFRLAHNLIYTLGQARRDRRARQNPTIDAWLAECLQNVREWFTKPLSKHIPLFRDVPMAQKWYTDWVEHQDYDDYWKQNGYNFEGFYDTFPDIPIYYFGGWYDFHNRGTIRNYMGVARIHTSPTFLMIGPWCHGPNSAQRTWQGDVDFGADSLVDWTEERLRFFDQFVLGKDTDLLNEPPVKLFVMGGGDGRKNTAGRMNAGGRWRFETTFPLPRTQFTNYYLHPEGGLNPNPPPAHAPPHTYSFDPKDPVPQIGGTYTVPFSMGAQDQVCKPGLLGCTDCLPLSARTDVLVFATPLLTNDVEVVGPLEVKLWASSSAVDTDFTAKLIDWYPPNEDYPSGYAMILQDSILRARYRESFERQVLMTPGQIYVFSIDLWATANLFKAGHRIRLDVSSSNFPTFDVNPNTGEKIGYHTKTVVAENTIYADREHPSHIILPIIP